MRIRAHLLVLLLLSLCATEAAAQYSVPGSAPTRTRWSHIQGDHFHLIFPREIDSLAREYLFLFESTRDATLTGLHIDAPRMPLVLQPYTMNSNGSVSWAPRHIELYTTPPGRILYAQDWPTQLAVHEGRHVGQFTHYTRGALFPFQIIAGEQGYALSFPSTTQMEGDAVQHETDITGAGRGRDPEFLKYYRAAFLAGDIRTYDAWRYGSYRYYTPNKYAFGYLINNNMRRRSGNYFTTGDLLEEKVHSWWRLFSQSHRSYIKASGTTVRKNWREAVANNNTVWQWEYKMRAPYSQSVPVLKGRSKYYAEFNDPLPFDGNVYATMTGLPFERRLVRIDSLGKHHYVRPFATNTSALVKDGDHSILFSEIVPDPRWEQRSWSILRRYDTRTGRMKTLTRRTRYVNPSVAPDGTILAAEYKVTGGSDVVVLNHDGKLLDRIPAPDNGQIVNVVQAGEARYATVVTPRGEGIYRYADGAWTCVVEPQKRAIHDLQAAGSDQLYFVTDLDGLSNVYAYHTGTGELQRWVNAPYGAARPYWDPADESLYYANYDHLGYLPVRLPAQKRDGKTASFQEPYVNHLADNNAAQMAEHVTPRTEEMDAALRRHIDSLETRPYRKILHGFRVHSWAPFYANVDRIMHDLGSFDFNNLESITQFVSLGATVLSQNDLGTVVTTLGYSYHKKHHGAHAYMRYSGLYPVFEAAFDFNERDRTFLVANMMPGGATVLDTIGKPSINFNLRVSVPLSFSKGGWTTTVTPRIGFAMTNDGYLYRTPDNCFIGSNYTRVLNADLLIDTRVARATSRLSPRLGFGMELIAQTRIGPGEIRKPIGSLRAYTYLPGFRAEDSFKLTYFRQHQDQGGLIYSPEYNLVRRPYGYDNMILMDYHRLLAEYALPIYAGDLNGGFFFYLKRIILIPFVDLARDLQSPTIDGGRIDGFGPRNFLSYGTRLLFNTYLFRIGTEFKIGIQYTRTYDSDKWGSIRFVLNTGL